VRNVMHDKEKKLKKALFDTKAEWKELTGACCSLQCLEQDSQID
jgi:hypothetical protein